MSGGSSFILGLGLFFLGMQLVGENLRHLSSRSFRRSIEKVASRPAVAGVVGLGFGALMQSATAVTFILAGMQKSGLVTALGAAPVILWSNVGLTALAFLVTLNIHPFVAFFVGGAGILSAMIRQSQWRIVASGLLGVGLILFGLESMGAGAEPLRSQAWFQALMASAVSSPILAFAVGIGAAALLQSNSGAAMLVITLAASGVFEVPQAALMIYGTNLGAIGLRFLLSTNLDRASQRLVRFEDLFCVCSGVVMLLLFWVESFGIPGPIALSGKIAEDSVATQLAILFLLSNAIPAAILSGFTGRIIEWLEHIMPGGRTLDLAHPHFISDTAVQDPYIAAGLALQESARLLGSLQVRPCHPEPGPDGESPADPQFAILAGSIEHFLAKTTSASRLDSDEAHVIHLLRAELGIIRYLEEATREFNETLCDLQEAGEPETTLTSYLGSLLSMASTTASKPTPDKVAAFRTRTRRHNDEITRARTETLNAAKTSSAHHAAKVAALVDAFDLALWMLHRLAKILDRYVTEEK